MTSLSALSVPWLLLFLLSTTHNGSALRCWSCQSDTNPDCNDPFEEAPHGPSACIPHATSHDRLGGTWPVCTKARIHVNEVESYVLRTCEWVSDSYPGFCKHHPELPPHSSLEFCESCRGDGCNSSGLATPSRLIVTFATIVLSLLVLL